MADLKEKRRLNVQEMTHLTTLCQLILDERGRIRDDASPEAVAESERCLRCYRVLTIAV